MTTLHASGADSDPRAHTQNVQHRLASDIEHLRSDIDKVEEPQLEAMFETAAEVLGGLLKAFQDYSGPTDGRRHTVRARSRYYGSTLTSALAGEAPFADSIRKSAVF